MPQIRHESSDVQTQKHCTNYQWFLTDWQFMHDYYYLHGIKSPEFSITYAEGSTCQFTLHPLHVPKHGPDVAKIEIVLHNVTDFITMEISISVLIEGKSKQLKVTSLSGRTVRYPIVMEIHPGFQKAGVDNYLKNGTLILLFEFTLVKPVTMPSVSMIHVNDTSTMSIREKLQEIRENQHFCNVTFNVGEQQFHAHKVILAANSKYFEAMFTSAMKEEKKRAIDIVDIDASVFKVFLDYVYTEKVDNLETVVDDLIVVADKYQHDDLKNLCENFMVAHLNHENAIKYLITAHQHSCKYLKAAAFSFINNSTHGFGNIRDCKQLCDCSELIEAILKKTE